MLDNELLKEENNEQNREPMNNGLNKSQKWAIAGLAVFAFLIVALWLVQLKNNIYSPLNSNSAGQSALNNGNSEELALKNKDTDEDGLADYDELNIYKTSPYLEDSDSDGVKDGVEINKGDDPNCPLGRTCLADSPLSAGTSTSAVSPADGANSLLYQSKALTDLLNEANQPNANNSLSADQLEALKNIDAAGLRELLIEAGMPKETLDKVSDEELLKSYGETLEGQ